MNFSTLKRFLVPLFAATTCWSSVHAQEAPLELPMWRDTEVAFAPLTVASEADAPEEAPPSFAPMALTPQSEASTDPEIVSLAASLGNDPLRIFNHVRNKIQYESYYGLKKGAVMTLVEGSGNDYDQCALLKALLLAAGQTDISYVSRRQAVYLVGNGGKNAAGWLGLADEPFPGQTFLQAYGVASPYTGVGLNDLQSKQLQFTAEWLLKTGIPGVQAWTDHVRVVFPRVWIRLGSGAAAKDLDPSYKRSEWLPPVDLAALTGYDRAALLTAATNGSTLTGPGWVQKLNKAGLTSYLDGIAGTLATQLLAQYPNATVEEIMGGRRIVPVEAASLSDCFPLGTDFHPGYGETVWPDVIPPEHMVKARFQAGTLDYSVPTAELGDERVSLSFSGNNMKLWVGDTEKGTTSAGSMINLTMSVIHPGGIGTRSKTDTYRKHDTYAYALIHAFRPTGKSLHRRYQKLDAYLDGGYADDSLQVRTELLNIMGLTWFYQTGLVADLMSARHKSIQIPHNRFGRVGQEGGFYIDVGLDGFATTASDGNEVDKGAVFYGGTLFASALEHGIIEQSQPGYSAVSTVNLIRSANDNNQELFLADINNWNAGPTGDRVKGKLVGYDGPTITAIEEEINKGRKLFLPKNANITQGTWKGTGYAIRGRQTLQLPPGQFRGEAASAMVLAGGYGGGWATSYGYVSSPPISNTSIFNPTYSYSPPAAPFDAYVVPPFNNPPLFGADPVDMATGAFTYGATDLETGLEPAPRGLRFSRSYTSNSRRQNTQNIGYGWTHDLYIRAEKRTASEEGLGLGSPRQAALTMVAMLAVADLYRDGATPKEWAAAILTAGWSVDRLTDNAVSVVIGQQVTQFTKRADGTFEPPTGSTMELMATGSGTSASYSMKQRHGNTIAFAYNSTLKVHRAVSITDPDGKSMSFTYHTDGRLNFVQDAYNRRYTFGYSGTGANALITSITDSTGRSVSYGYGTDGNKNLSTFTDPENKTESYDYALAGDPAGQAALHRIRRVRDQIRSTAHPIGRTVTENDYDSVGRVSTQRLHGDPAKTCVLNYAGRITTETNPAGGVTTYYYDDRGRSTGIKDPSGNLSNWKYDGQDHVVEKTSATEETTVFHYDGRHNLTQIDHPRGGGSTFAGYDALDRIHLITDPDSRQTQYIYNPGNIKNRPDSIIDAAGTTIYEYKTSGPAIGQIWKVTADGLTTEYEYETAANTYAHPDWVKAPGGFTTDYTYTARGDLQSIVDPNLVVTAYLYNGRRQVTKTTIDAGGADEAVEDTAYDDAGNVASVTYPADNGGQRFKARSEYSPTKKIRFAYTSDEDGEGPNDPVTETRYDERDWQKETIDPLTRLTSFLPKPNGQLHKAILPLARTSKQLLDGDERPVSMTKPGSPGDRVTTISYGVSSTSAGDVTNGYPKTVTTTPDTNSVTDETDRGGNLRYHTNREGKRWEFRYDGGGRRTHVISPLDAAASRAHVTEYHPRGVVKKVTEPSGDPTNFSYDPTTGRLASVTDLVGTVQNTLYDANGNLKTSVETRGGATKTTQRTFDRQNRLISRTDENGQTIGYRYYPSGKLWKLIYPGGTENGTGHVEYTWGKSGQLKDVIDKLDSTATPRTTSYQWNKDGKLAKVTRLYNGTVREIKYDAAGRPFIVEEYGPGRKLILVHKHGFHPSDEMAWRYELPAKRTSGLPPPATAAMTYNADNQLDTWGGNSVVQDADGNMTSGPAPTGASLASYGYDARNRLISAPGLTYTYDSDGHRVGVSGTSETTTYVVDGSSALSKTLVRTKNGETTRYVWGVGLLYEVSSAGAATTYHYDGTGNTLALTDGDAKVIERIGYSPLGTIEHRVNVTGTPHDTPFLFTGFYGNQTDANGLLHMRARYYHPRLGRFLNADPAREGWNWYGYAAGNPMGFVDPSGLGITSALNMVQDTLSFLGMIPVFGAAFDVVNAGISFFRGDMVGAAINLISAAPGFGDFVGGAKIAGGIASAAFMGGRIVDNAAPLAKYEVGAYNVLRRGADAGLDAHHVGQKAIMPQFIPNYNPYTAPAILVPRVGHTVGSGVLSRSTAGFTNARQVIARDILELRRIYPDLPNSQLKKLIDLNKSMYPDSFIKPPKP